MVGLVVVTRLLVVMVDEEEVFVVRVEEWLDEGGELFGEGVEFSHEEEWVAWWGLVQFPVVLMPQRPRLAWASWHSSRSLASHAQRLGQQTFSFEIFLRTGHHCALCRQQTQFVEPFH